MAELKREGKILQWGMGNFDAGDMQNVLSLPDGGDCAADQVLYNMGSRGAEYGLIPWCARRGIPIMAYTPFEGEGGGMASAAGCWRKSPADVAPSPRKSCWRGQSAAA